MRDGTRERWGAFSAPGERKKQFPGANRGSGAPGRDETVAAGREGDRIERGFRKLSKDLSTIFA